MNIKGDTEYLAFTFISGSEFQILIAVVLKCKHSHQVCFPKALESDGKSTIWKFARNLIIQRSTAQRMAESFFVIHQEIRWFNK